MLESTAVFMKDKILSLQHELAEARAWLADTEAEYAKRVHELDEARAQIAAKDAALREARAMVEDWGGYAAGYFQEKHDLAGDLARIDAALTTPARETE